MGFPAIGPPGRQSAIPTPWATLACWFRTTSLVYLFSISPTVTHAEAAEEEADWVGLYEDPTNYDAQRWTPVPLELFVERNTGEKFERPPGVLPIYQCGVATLPD
jgi:hypothetical protein